MATGFFFFFLESEHSLGSLTLKLECQVDGHTPSNSSTQEVGTGRLLLGSSLLLQGQPGLHSEFQATWSYTERPSLKKKNKKQKQKQKRA